MPAHADFAAVQASADEDVTTADDLRRAVLMLLAALVATAYAAWTLG